MSSNSETSELNPLTSWLQNPFLSPPSEVESDQGDHRPVTPSPLSRKHQAADVLICTPSETPARPTVPSKPTTVLAQGQDEEDDLGPYSSPIRGRTPAEKRASKAQKKAKKSALIAVKKEAEKAARLAEQSRKMVQAEEARLQAISLKKQTIREVLDHLRSCKLTIGDLLLFIVDPNNWAGREQHEGLFKRPTLFPEVLDFLISARSSSTARSIIHEWAMSYTSRVLSQEGNSITSSGILRAENKTIGASFALNFSILNIYKTIHQYCPNAIRLLLAFGTSSKQNRTMSESAVLKKKRVSDANSILFTKPNLTCFEVYCFCSPHTAQCTESEEQLCPPSNWSLSVCGRRTASGIQCALASWYVLQL